MHFQIYQVNLLQHLMIRSVEYLNSTFFQSHGAVNGSQRLHILLEIHLHNIRTTNSHGMV